MVKCSFAHMDCSVARSLDIIGEWWTMLIVRDLMPILMALMQWGDKWRPDPENADVRFVDRLNHEPIAPIRVSATDGRTLGPADIAVVPLKETMQRFLQN